MFLDVTGDRYLCLSRALEKHFVDWLRGQGLSSDARNRLSASGLFIPAAEGAVPQPCQPLPSTGESLLDGAPGRWNAIETAHAFVALTGTAFALKRWGLARLLTGFARHKARLRQPATKEQADVIVAAFARTAYLTTTHDRCLVRSAAMARRMVSAGLSADLALGIKLEPFKAHCWVQHEGRIANDRWDVIREFTPIFVL